MPPFFLRDLNFYFFSILVIFKKSVAVIFYIKRISRISFNATGFQVNQLIRL